MAEEAGVVEEGQETAEVGAPEQTSTTEQATEAAVETATEQAKAPPIEQAKAAADWRAAIKDEALRKHAERFPGPEDVVKNHFELRQRLSKAVFVPGKDAKPEDISAFRKALNVPEKIEDYKVELPQGIDKSVLKDEKVQADLKSVAELALKHNISTDAFKALAAWDMQRGQKMQQDAVQADKQFADESLAALKDNWGPQFDREKEYANRGAEWAFEREFEDFRSLKTADDRLIADHPLVLKAFNRIGRAISEDTMPGFFPMDANAIGDLKEQLGKLTEEQDTAMQAGDTAKAKRLDEKIFELSRKISGDAPLS